MPGNVSEKNMGPAPAVPRTYVRIREDIHDAVMRGIDFSRSVEDGEVLELIDREIVRARRAGELNLDEMKQLRLELFNSIRRLDILQELIEDPTITEIMINGPNHVFIERAGKLRRTDRTFVSREKLEDVVQLLFRNYLSLFCLSLFTSKSLFYAENNDKYVFLARIRQVYRL